MERTLIFVVSILFTAGTVAKATNRSVAASGDRHEHHYLDMRERMDHMEEKLDSATCKLDKLQTEISEKLHSFESLLDAKLDTTVLKLERSVNARLENIEVKLEQRIGAKLENMELKVERSIRSELRDQMTTQMDRILSILKIQQFEQSRRNEDEVGRILLDSDTDISGPMRNLSEAKTPHCNVNPDLEHKLEQLVFRTNACILAADVVSGRNRSTDYRYSTSGADRPHEWIPIMRRVTGHVNFSRDWDEYKSGFGDLGGEFWLGLEDIHQLTSRRSHRLRVVLADFSGEVKFTEYSTFYLQGEALNYRIHVTGYVKGSTAGDSLSFHNGMDFTTQDRDNDQSANNCATPHRGGWWYKNCDYSHLTGQYLPAGDKSDNGVVWDSAYGDSRSFKGAEMSIREV